MIIYREMVGLVSQIIVSPQDLFFSGYQVREGYL